MNVCSLAKMRIKDVFHFYLCEWRWPISSIMTSVFVLICIVQGRIYRDAGGTHPLYFFEEMGHLTLCGHLKQNKMSQIVHIYFENYIYPLLLRGHITPQTPPVPTGAKILSVLNLDTPFFRKFWIHPCHM